MRPSTLAFRARASIAAALAAGLAIGVGPVNAADFPSGPVTLIVAYNAGGGVDVNARLLAAKLAARWGHPVNVLNRPGGEGAIASVAVAAARPDGHTLGLFVNHLTNPPLGQDVGFDPLTSFTPVTRLWLNPNVILVNPEIVPVSTLPEFIEYAKSKPGELNYVSLGTGSSSTIASRAIVDATGLQMTEVAYKGASEALPPLYRGDVHLFTSAIATSMGDIKAGKLRALAVTSAKPSAALPDVPPVADTISGFSSGTWYGVVAPAGLPVELTEKVAADFAAAVNEPDIRKQLEVIAGSEIILSNGTDFAEFIAAEYRKWQELHAAK